jgi:hypothetical protein
VDALLAYCQQANDYLYQRLDGLLPVEVKWQPLAHSHIQQDAGSEGFQGFIGRYTYYVMRAMVLQKEKTPIRILHEDQPYLISSWPLERAINHIVDEADHRPISGVIYIIPGTTSLVAPFSELLHLSLHAASQRYADTLAKQMPPAQARKRARGAGETTNEAAATLLAAEFLRTRQHQERLPAIAKVAHNMASQYPLLPYAMDYMEQYGIQYALAQYQDDPSTFMQRIRPS